VDNFVDHWSRLDRNPSVTLISVKLTKNWSILKIHKKQILEMYKQMLIGQGGRWMR
jgi:hypothetical protein